MNSTETKPDGKVVEGRVNPDDDRTYINTGNGWTSRPAEGSKVDFGDGRAYNVVSEAGAPGGVGGQLTSLGGGGGGGGGGGEGGTPIKPSDLAKFAELMSRVDNLTESERSYLTMLQYKLFGRGAPGGGVTDKTYSTLTEEQKMFVALVYGEIGGESQIYWKIAAHTIMNCYNNPTDIFYWVKSVKDVITGGVKYDAYHARAYNEAMSYLNNREGSNKRVEEIISTVMPIYYGEKDDITDGAQMFFNGAMQSWMYNCDEVHISGVDPKIIRLLKYR